MTSRIMVCVGACLSPVGLRRTHLILAGVWTLSLLPGLTIWRESVPFLIICSIYANIAGELSAWQASRVEVRQDEIEAASLINSGGGSECSTDGGCE